MILQELANAPLSLGSYTLLLFSIASLWIHRNPQIWGTALLVALLLGLVAERVQPVGFGAIVAFAFCCYASWNGRYSKAFRISLGATVLLLSIALTAHLLPGFNNWRILDSFTLSENSTPYSMFLNFDQPLVGLFLLGFGPPLLMGRKQWSDMLKLVMPIMLTGLTIVYGLALGMQYAAIDIKFPAFFPVWVLHNLLLTCVAEEALFRGFLQRHLDSSLERYPWGKMTSLATVSLLFGLAHFQGGAAYILLATVAGLLYGYAFQKTKRIEASILTHFLLNTGHLLFFTYPSLL
ncbi:MAG: CPBP family intramembrane metalloprotease [Gammaproteobacteria bacterium]|nr:CPBP family intramembrane metalloprotease [Gammaproteobacteria bacterium]